MPYSLRLVPNVLTPGDVATVHAEFFDRLKKPCSLKLVEVDEQGLSPTEVASFEVTVDKAKINKVTTLVFGPATRKDTPPEPAEETPTFRLRFDGQTEEHVVAVAKPRSSAEGRYFELTVVVHDPEGNEVFPAGAPPPVTYLDCGDLPVVELALPGEGLGADAQLVLEPTGGGEATTLRRAETTDPDGLVSFPVTVADLPEAASWAVKLVDGGATTVLLEGVALRDLAQTQPPAQGQGQPVTQRLSVSARDAKGAAVALTAVRLASLPTATKLDLAQATDALGPFAVDLGAVTDGRYRLAIDPANAPEVSYLLRLDSAADGTRALTLVHAPPGCRVLRLRSGLPGSWSRVEHVAVMRPYALRALMVPCFSDVVTHTDGKNAVGYAKQLRQRYATQGYVETKILPAASWDVVVEDLEQAAKDGAPYTRVVTIGHGGWDGPILEGGQWSTFYNEDLLDRLCDALELATTPFAQMYVSNCHGGGSNKFEAPEWERRKREHAPVMAKVTAELEAAKQALADATTEAERQKRQAALDDAQTRYDQEAYEDRSIDNMLYRWSDDVARRTGRFIAGPMGITSNGYTVEHAKAVFEGEGKTRQEVWITDPLEGVVRMIPAGGTLATAKVTPLTP